MCSLDFSFSGNGASGKGKTRTAVCIGRFLYWDSPVVLYYNVVWAYKYN